MTTETLTAQSLAFKEVNTGIEPNAILVAEVDVFNPIVAQYCYANGLSCYPCSLLLPGQPRFILS